MKTVTVSINLYSVDELGDKAKEVAIEEHRNFLLSECILNGNSPTGESDYLSEVEDIEDNDDYVLENIHANDYLYFYDGKLAKTVSDCGKHPTAGITEFMDQDQVYCI